jgi:radical SAM superfamily enzyme with C-terminal helix-hairpin-helix motif
MKGLDAPNLKGLALASIYNKEEFSLREESRRSVEIITTCHTPGNPVHCCWKTNDDEVNKERNRKGM